MACKRPWKIYHRSLNASRGLILRSSFVNHALHAAAPRRQTAAGSFPLADQRDLWCLGDKMERGNENKITRSFPQEPLTSNGSAQARLWGAGWRDASCVVWVFFWGAHSTHLLVCSGKWKGGGYCGTSYCLHMERWAREKGMKHVSKPSLPHLQPTPTWNKFQIRTNRHDFAYAADSFPVTTI